MGKLRMSSSEPRSARAISSSVTSGCFFFISCRLIARIWANTCPMSWRTWSRLAITSNSFWTSSFDAASGAIDTVVCANAQADTETTKAQSQTLSFITASRMRPRFCLPVVVQRLQTEEPRRAPQFLLNAQQLVVLRNPIRARRRPGLDLSRAGRHSQIGDERILRLTGAVRDHRGISVAPCQINRIERFAHRANLIHLDQNRIGDVLINSLLQELHVRDKQVVPDQLNLLPHFLGQILPALPIVLRQTVLERDDRIVIYPLRPELHHLVRTLGRLVGL